jgi:hypothetical protein
MNAVADKLREARATLTPEEAWAQGASAYDASHKQVRETDPTAVCWCALGAIARAFNSHYGDDYHQSVTFMLSAARTHDLAFWNDSSQRTHGQVLLAFDRAIELAERDQ